MKTKKEIYPGGGLRNVWDISEDAINVKDNMKAGTGIEHARNSLWE